MGSKKQNEGANGGADDLSTIELARQTMTGDLRDAALSWIRALQKPWKQLSEDDQLLVIESVTKQAAELVDKAVKVIVADQRRAIDATVESVTVKDGIKAVLTCTRTEENLVDLGMAQGSRVIVASVDSSAFSGERAPAKPDPVQPELFTARHPLGDSGDPGVQ